MCKYGECSRARARARVRACHLAGLSNHCPDKREIIGGLFWAPFIIKRALSFSLSL